MARSLPSIPARRLTPLRFDPQGLVGPGTALGVEARDMDCHHQGRPSPERRGKGHTRFADLQLDDIDHILLTVARHFFRDLALADRGDRSLAVTVAEISFGHGRGTAMAAAVLRAIHVLRLSRRDTFFFGNPDCRTCSELLTEAELLFVQVFHAVRMGSNSAAAVHALLLCEGNDPAPFLEAVSQVFSLVSGARWQSEAETWLTD